MLHTELTIFQFITFLTSKDPLNVANHAANKLLKEVSPTEATDKMSMLLDKIITWGFSIGGRVIAALIIFVIGRFAIKILNKLIRKILSRKSVDRGVASFIGSLLNTLLMLLLIIAVINKLGIETTSFAALLASFGVAIGMAMSGNLSNLVGGMIILLFRPYKVDDWIRVQDILGKVKSIEIFHTVLLTPSGEHVYLSNGTMSTAIIKNYSQEGHLRTEVKVGIDYGESIERATALLLSIAKNDNRILTEPEPVVAVDSLSENSVDLILRVWTNGTDYWMMKLDLNHRIYNLFQKEGISIPYPQLTIHHGKD
jgi:small conductance mechanosensitive channel